MFGSHFYHATMRKSVAVFGTLFNDIKVIRKGASGAVLNQVKVPLAYGPKQKFLARLDQETGFDAPMAIKLPRMAFEMTSLELDTNIKQQKMNKIVEDHASDVSKKKTISHYTSYNIGMQLNILAKNQDDGLQIVEQILPYFQPEYTITIKPVDGFDHKQDVPIVLTGVSIQDEYEGDFTERRVLTYQLDFTMKMKFYGPTRDQSIIRTINLDFEKQVPAEFFQGLNFSVGASDSASSFTISTTRDTIAPGNIGPANTITETVGVQSVIIPVTVTQPVPNDDTIFINDATGLGLTNIVTIGSSSFSFPTVKEFLFTATAGQTKFGGTDGSGNPIFDNNGQTLSYAQGSEEVFVNNVRKYSPADYARTDLDGTGAGSITFGTGLSAGDTVKINSTAAAAIEGVNYSANLIDINVNATLAVGDTLNVSGNKYFIGDIQQREYNMVRGNTYIFNHPAAHPFRFSTVEDGTHNGGNEYTVGVTTTTTSAQLVPDSSTPDTLYYYCSNHSGMGGKINITG